MEWMKRLRKVMAVCAVVLLAVAVLAGCSSPKSVVGVWTLTTSNNDWYVVGDMLRLNEDGTVLYESQSMNRTLSGTYQLLDSGQLKLSLGGETYLCDYSVDRESLTGTFGDVTLVFRH